MQKFKALLLGTAVGLCQIAPAMAEDVASSTVVATVGETEITVGHMIAMTASLPAEQKQMPAQQLFDGILERLIQQEAVSQSNPNLSPLTALQLENERRSLIASDIVNQMVESVVVSDDDVQAAYTAQYSNFTPEKEFNASHILVETEDEAKAIIAELDAGGDFTELAKMKSTGPSGPNGGNLNWFGMGRMVPAFEAAVIALETGQISAPVQTQFGWHVIKLNDVREPGVPTIDDVRDELEQQIWRETLQADITALIDKATIERKDVSAIDPAVVGDLSLLQN